MCEEQQKSIDWTLETQEWKFKKRENTACTKRRNRSGRFCLEESVSDLIQGKIDCGDERKNLTIDHAKISKKRSKINYRSGIFMFERCRKEMENVSGSIDDIKRFILLDKAKYTWKCMEVPIHEFYSPCKFPPVFLQHNTGKNKILQNSKISLWILQPLHGRIKGKLKWQFWKGCRALNFCHLDSFLPSELNYHHL